MRVVMAGVPGSGKGTQAKLLSKHLGIPHISTGDMFRRAIACRSELGKLAERLINHGQFIPDDVTIGIVSERIAEADCRSGYILDGFPRTLAQAKAAQKNGVLPDVAIILEVRPPIAVQRIVDRLTCGDCGAVFSPEFHMVDLDEECPACHGSLRRRVDDTKEIALERMDVYQRLTAPAVEHLKVSMPHLVVDGDESIYEVFDTIVDGLRRISRDTRLHA